MVITKYHKNLICGSMLRYGECRAEQKDERSVFICAPRGDPSLSTFCLQQLSYNVSHASHAHTHNSTFKKYYYQRKIEKCSFFLFELKILNKRAFGHCLVPPQHVKVQRSSAFQNPRKVRPRWCCWAVVMSHRICQLGFVMPLSWGGSI